MQADSPIADDHRTDESYGPEYGPVPVEREHSLYHPSPLPVPSRGTVGRWVDYHEVYDPWEELRPPPFFRGNALWSGRRRANRTPTRTVTVWPDGPVLNDAQVKMAMANLRKHTYAPSPTPQKKACAFRRMVSGIFQTQKSTATAESPPNNAEEEEKACAICLQTFRRQEEVVVTLCNHMFHQECAAPWVKEHGDCPVCRSALCNRGCVVEEFHYSEEDAGGAGCGGLLAMIRNMGLTSTNSSDQQTSCIRVNINSF